MQGMLERGRRQLFSEHVNDRKQGRQEIQTSPVVPCRDFVPPLQLVECSLGQVPPPVQFQVVFPTVLFFVAMRIFTPSCRKSLIKDQPLTGETHLIVQVPLVKIRIDQCATYIARSRLAAF